MEAGGGTLTLRAGPRRDVCDQCSSQRGYGIMGNCRSPSSSPSPLKGEGICRGRGPHPHPPPSPLKGEGIYRGQGSLTLILRLLPSREKGPAGGLTLILAFSPQGRRDLQAPRLTAKGAVPVNRPLLVVRYADLRLRVALTVPASPLSTTIPSSPWRSGFRRSHRPRQLPQRRPQAPASSRRSSGRRSCRQLSTECL